MPPFGFCIFGMWLNFAVIPSQHSSYNNLFVPTFTSLKSISVAILAHRKDQENASNLNINGEKEKKSNDASAKLRHDSSKAYHSLVVYGSSSDLCSQGSAEDNHTVFLSEAKRSRLLDVGRNLWMAIRNNPELFNDMNSGDKGADGGDFVSFLL